MALVVITGGARSGKSRAAQHLADERHRTGQPVVVAVFASDSDSEMTERIAKHRLHRPDGFDVVEVAQGVAWLESVPADSLLVVDCLGTCLGLAMLHAWTAAAGPDLDMTDATELPEPLAPAFEHGVGDVVAGLAARIGDTIIVTNEVGAGIVPTHATGRLFRDELGRANAALIGTADAAYLAVAGRLFDLAALPREAVWPED